MRLEPSYYTLKIRRKKNSLKTYKDEAKIERVEREVAILEVAKNIVMIHSLEEIKMIHKLNVLECKDLHNRLKKKRTPPNERREIQNTLEWKEIRKSALDFILGVNTQVKKRPARRARKKVIWLND